MILVRLQKYEKNSLTKSNDCKKELQKLYMFFKKVFKFIKLGF